MQLLEVTINNYKSFGEQENVLKFTPSVTAVIGKNESGKSNLLQALGYINLYGGMLDSFFSNLNRLMDGKDVSLTAKFKIYKGDFDSNIHGIVDFHFKEPRIVEFSGVLTDIINSNNELSSDIETLKEIGKNIKFQNNQNEASLYRGYINSLDNISTRVFVYKNFVSNFERWVNSIIDENDRSACLHAAKRISKYLYSIYCRFPKFYLYNEQALQNTYVCTEDYIDGLSNEDDFFADFLVAAKIDLDLLRKACINTNIGIQKDAKDEINELIKKNIEIPFNKFYPQEEVKISVLIDSTKFNILIKTGTSSQMMSERSDGLKWYLNFYIDFLASDIQSDNMIFVIDEPGVRLHVEAQKKLLELFDDLTKRKNQLIYSTHSPYMLDNKKMISIRAIQKKVDFTFIYNNFHHIPKKEKEDRVTRLDTLSPFLDVIGLKVNDNFASFPRNKLNVITEGISDYLYLSAMQKHLKETSINFIPSTGVTNIHNLASILIGWGYLPKVVVDFDKEGNAAISKLEKDLNLIVNADCFFINCEESYDTGKQQTIEDIISTVDNEKLDYPYDGTKSTKKIAAQCFFNSIISKQFIPEDDTVANFKKIFNKLKATV